MIRKAIFTILLALSTILTAAAYNQGDILFQESRSAQSPYIKAATGSRYTHCGVIVKKNGRDYVLEASSRVKLTPVAEWIKRGKGSHVKVRKCPVKNFKVNTSKYLGKRYDTAFKWSDNRMYCSELVYKVYLDNGITLCPLRRVSSYRVGRYKSYLRKRGIDLNQKVVAPSDLL